MADRYCRNCGHELETNGRFCAGCGGAVQQTAHIPTPQANVPLNPPPYQQQSVFNPQQVSSSGSGMGRVRTRYYWITLVVLSVLALIAGDNGTAVGIIILGVSAIWVYRDAKSRSMDSAGLWVLGVILLWIVFFPLYFFRRKPQRY